MRAFVTGGSGFVGGHLIRRLRGDGHEVKALARSDESARRVSELGASPVRGDLDAIDVLAGSVRGGDVVFHAAAVVGTHIDKVEANRVNVKGTENVLTAARASGARRLVHLSTESVLHDGRPLDGVDESIPIPASGHLSEYAASKARAEEIVTGMSGPDLETVALRPRLIWGPEDGAWLPGLVEKVESGVFRWVDEGRHLGSTCHVYNVVEALVLAADRGSPGEAYFITDGPPRTFKEFASAYLATVDVNPGESSVPGWVMRSVGATLETIWRWLPTSSAPPINRVEAYMVSHPQVFDDSKARADLGYRPVISVDEGLAELSN